MLQISIGGTDEHQFKYSMLAMVLFGLGEILGCFFIGYFIDAYGSKFAVFVNMLIIFVMSVSTLVFVWQFNYNFFAFLMCFMWGF